MKEELDKKYLIIGIFFIFILTSLTPITTGHIINTPINETEYWALLIAGGVYAGHPEENRPSMLYDVEDLYEMLLISEHWSEDNIKFINHVLVQKLS